MAKVTCDSCKRPPEEHGDSDAGPMTVCPVASPSVCQGDRYDAEGHRFFECGRTDTASFFTLSGEDVVLCPECADREDRENTI